MSRIKTILLALSMTIGTVSHASENGDLADIIAICAGRMSAEMEFAWLLSNPEAERLEMQRFRFVEILESLPTKTSPRDQLALRIDTKIAHAGLLTLAHFGTDQARAVWAKRQAFRETRRCQNMLLDS